MKNLYRIAFFFGIAYSLLVLHYALFDRESKTQEIGAVASRLKYIAPSLSFKGKEYERFVYDF